MVTSQPDSQDFDPLVQGVALLNRGEPQKAFQVFRQALDCDPENALANYNAGVACQTLQDNHQAICFYQRAIHLRPDFHLAHHNLAQAYTDQNQLKLAIKTYLQALAAAPEDFKSAYNLSLLYRRMGNEQAAIKTCQQSLQAKPDFAEAFCNLGLMYCDQNRFGEALVCLEQALMINPALTEAHHNMGVVYQKRGQYERGLTSYRKSLVCDPGYAPAQWLRLLSLPMMYDTPAQIEHYRRLFKQNLDQLIDGTPLTTIAEKQFALSGIRTTTNFYLQYQGGNDLDLQKKYGRFVHRVMAANYPQWTKLRPMPPRHGNEKIRIGYVSSMMYRHTVGTFLSGWVENQDHITFNIHCYHVGRKCDAMTDHFRNISHHFHYFPGDVEAAAKQIDKDRLHLLIYSDIGMDPVTLQLAALRLAPVQCKGWGHPVTTGLPTMDYYLTSDLMEPPHADQFYSETLVRLPNLALYYTQPRLPRQPKSRQELGIPTDRFIYISTQSVFKYLPQYDDLYVQIACQVPHACFVFISNPSSLATHRFVQRLRRSFKKFDLDADQFCQFVPQLNFNDFLSLNLSADVLLDTFDWSGGKTTLEALSCGLPVVTCPGKYMRGRHAYAMLKRIGLPDTIATDHTAYGRIAVRLALDADFYARVKQKLEAGIYKLYKDHDFINHLELFYQSVVRDDQPIDARYEYIN